MRKLLLLIGFCQWATGAGAQYSFSAGATGTIIIGATMGMTYTSLAGSFSISNFSDFQNGQTTLNTATIAVSSNVPWMLKIAANATVFTATGGGASNNMPCSVVGVRVNGTGSFLTLSTAQQTLNSGNSGTASASGNTFNTDVFFNPGFSYPGGNYSLGVVYTLTGQ